MAVAGLLGALALAFAVFFAARWRHRRRRAPSGVAPAERLLLDPERAAAELVGQPEVQDALAQEPGDPVAALDRAHRYARDIVPYLDSSFYLRLFGGPLRSAVTRLFRVRVRVQDEVALAARMEDSTPVFVLNHRSNLDYLLAATALADRAIVSFAAGEWARYWPFEWLLRTVGGFFVQRESGNRLYRAVVAAHVRRSVEDGVPQAFFIEGNLSLDGKLRPPRLGLLDYSVRGFGPGAGRDVVFIPTAVNYDWVLEDRNLQLMKTRGARPSRLRYTQAAIGFWLHQLWLVVTRRWHPFGQANLTFGRPLSLAAWAGERGLDPRHADRERRFQAVEQLAAELMDRIAGVMPVLPVPLMATVIARAGDDGISAGEARARALTLVDAMRGGDLADFDPSDWRHAVDSGLHTLARRRMIVNEGGKLRVSAARRGLLEYYANSVAHLAPAQPG